MRGVLFDDFEVELHPDTALYGGSFQGTDEQGRLTAWDAPMLKFFYEQIRQHPTPTVLDVGANTGSFSLLAVHHPGMIVRAFEPQDRIFKRLVGNLALNKLAGRATALNVALMEAHGLSAMAVPDRQDQSGLACLGTPARFVNGHAEPVMCTTLDRYWAEQNANGAPVDFIKIDVEGAELFTLRGGEHTIRRERPQLLVECDPRNTAQFGYDADKIPALLRSWGAHVESVGKADLWVTWP